MDYKSINLEAREFKFSDLRELSNFDFKQWCIVYSAYGDIDYNIKRDSCVYGINSTKVEFALMHNLGFKYFTIASFNFTENSLSLKIKNLYGLKQGYYNRLDIRTYKNIIMKYSKIEFSTYDYLFFVKKVDLFNSLKAYNKNILSNRINEFKLASKNICCNL